MLDYGGDMISMIEMNLVEFQDSSKEWRNPEAPSSMSNPTPKPGGRGERKGEVCSFFMKTGACRFRDRYVFD